MAFRLSIKGHKLHDKALCFISYEAETTAPTARATDAAVRDVVGRDAIGASLNDTEARKAISELDSRHDLPVCWRFKLG